MKKKLGQFGNEIPILFEKKENCCGCSACFSVCPINAISMEIDVEGFSYPIVDKDKCVFCYKCLSVCAFKNEQQKKGYL